MKAGVLFLLASLGACAPTVDARQWEAKRNIVALEGEHARGLAGQGIVDCIVTSASYVELTSIIAASSQRQVDRAVAPVLARPEYNACLGRLYGVAAG